LTGWRKLSFAAAIIVGVFAWLFAKTQDPAVVPDIPSNVRDILIVVYGTFAGGNVAEHFSKMRQAVKP
jgi:hypothetical protein